MKTKNANRNIFFQAFFWLGRSDKMSCDVLTKGQQMSNTKYGKAQQICLSTVWLNLWWKFEVQTKQKCCSQILHRSAAASSKLSFNIQHWSYLSPKKWTFAFSLPPAAVVCFPPRLCELSGVQHWDEVALDGLDFLVLCTVEMVQICLTNTDQRNLGKVWSLLQTDASF